LTSRGLGTLLLLLLATLGGGSRQIHLNWAMERVNERYVDLFYGVETGGRDDIRAEVRELVEALSDPAIADYSPEADYQRFLAETNEAASLLYEEARGGERQPLLLLRSRLSTTCQTCHERYRP
jgi:hypothetical protein